MRLHEQGRGASIRAMDRPGIRTAPPWVVALAALRAELCFTVPAQAKRIALVVGNVAYSGVHWFRNDDFGFRLARTFPRRKRRTLAS